jgi:hypothetical protein
MVFVVTLPMDNGNQGFFFEGENHLKHHPLLSLSLLPYHACSPLVS